MYLIPKNIKVKREIFKGFGMLEIIAMAISFGIGFLLQHFVSMFKIKVILFFAFPITTFLMLLPLPNGTTPFTIFKKFIYFISNKLICIIYHFFSYYYCIFIFRIIYINFNISN